MKVYSVSVANDLPDSKLVDPKKYFIGLATVYTYYIVLQRKP